MSELRICLRTTGDLVSKIVNGKTIYEASSPLVLFYGQTLALLHKNTSFFFSREDFTVCHNRLESNESDFASEFYPSSDDETFYFVPAPNEAIKVSMLTGYDLQDTSTNEVVNALANFKLVDLDVYLITKAFLLVFALLVAARTLLSIEWRRVQGHEVLAPPQKGFKSRMVRRQVRIFFDGSSKRFRFITLLLNVLIFYLVTYYCSVYSTSNIILKRPEIVDSYLKLIQHQKSMPIFMNFLTNVTRQFIGEPESSLRGRIWSKVGKHPNQIEDYDHVALFKAMQSSYQSMRRNKDVMIASTLTTPTCKSFFCGSSPEGQLRVLLEFQDGSEGEKLLGFPLSTSFKDKKIVARKLSLLAQSGCLRFLLDQLARHFFDKTQQISGTSQAHGYRQKLLCDGDLTIDSYQKIKPLGLDYWKSFGIFLLGLVALAFFLLIIEIIVSRND